MKLRDYCKGKISFLIIQVLLCIFLAVLLKVYHVNSYACALMLCALFLGNIGWLFFDFVQRYRYYKTLQNTLQQMDQKHLIAGFLEDPYFIDAEILCDVIKETTKAMNDEIASYKIAQDEYHEYIETWIHEIKIPISCIDLICKNTRNELTYKIQEETQRVDNYVEQALFYARSTNVAADYSIRKLLLSDIVKKTVKKHSKQLIACDTQLQFDLEGFSVYADEKWLDFILGQIMANSMKYKKDILKLSFSAKQNTESIVLSVQVNGIGIPEQDIPRVLEKGFTGQNGRAFAKSTGIGLYLCKIMCEKMYLGLKVTSTMGEGTTIQIIFPKDRSSFLE